MRFSVAAAVMAATDPFVLAASSAENSSSPKPTTIAEVRWVGGDDRIDTGNPKIRTYRNHWTMPDGAATGGKKTPHSHPSKSVLVNNQKSNKETENIGTESSEDSDKTSARESHQGKDDTDLGILSSSRRMEPEETSFIKASRPDSGIFDSFNTVDQDGKVFYPICDTTPDDEYLCFRCDKDEEEEIVGDFDCQKISCYEIDSRCPNNQMVVCRYDTLIRMFDDDPPENATSIPYTSEKCRKIETRLTKTDRELLPDEESSWDFTYCLRYNIASKPSLDEEAKTNGTSPPNTCQMEVDGVVCSSCLLETYSVVDESTSTTSGQKFCAIFDCANTLLGYSGRFCDSADLAIKSLDYFVYRSLPCDGGCNLCGDRTSADPTKMMMMEFRESDFALVDYTNETEYLNILSLPSTRNCFEAQWDALMGPTPEIYCNAQQSAVQEACGCMLLGEEAPSQAPSSAPTEDDGIDSGAILTAGMIDGRFLVGASAASLIGMGLVQAMAV